MFAGNDKWVVLRCGSKNTMRLVDALKAHAFDAWSPVKIVVRRLPRRNTRIKDEISTLPSFVFLPEGDSESAISLMRSNATPSFSVMRVLGRVVSVNRSELDFMQRVSWCNIKSDIFPIGSYVRFRSGSFEGIRAKVLSSSNKDCTVEIEGSSTVVKVPPFLLLQLQA